MVGISLQDDVRKSFANVKEDILNLKRTVNRELLAAEEIGGRLQTFVAKDEFYSFIKRLGERLDRIDENLEAYLGYEDDIKSVDGKVKGLDRRISRREDLEKDVKEVRALRGKLAALEGSAISAQKFNESVGRVYSDVASVKASMLTAKSLEGLKASLANAEKRVEALEKAVPSKADVSSGLASVEELRKRVDDFEGGAVKKAEEAEQENVKRIEDVSVRLTADIGSLKASCVDRNSFEKTIKELRKDSASMRSILESSVSEVDFSDYVTKRELGKKLLALEELNSEIGRVAQDAEAIGNSLEALKRETASVEEIRRLGGDVKEISKSLDSLRAVIEKVSDSSQKRFSQELERLDVKFEREISRLKDDFAGKLERVEREKVPAKSGGGVLARLGRGFADFFREEEEKDVRIKAKAAPSVSELLKEEEAKKPKKHTGFGLYLAWIAIFILASVLFVLWFSNKPVEVGSSLNISHEEPSQAPSEELPPEGGETISEPSADEETSDAQGSNEAMSAPGTIEYCLENYECKERGDGNYWFSCYLDEEETCRCFVTDAEGCGIVEGKLEKAAEVGSDGKGRVGYLITAVIVFAIFLAVYLSVLRNNKAGGKKQKKEKRKEKEAGNGVDLEEFFEKK